MADWGNLPRDLLLLIAQQLTFMEDVIRLSASCKAWSQSTESLISGKDELLLPPGSPWLMLSDNVNDMVTSSHIIKKRRSEDIKPRRFFKLSSGKTYEFKLPEASGRKCVGAGHGWLLTLGVDLQINLLYPFSRQQIPLPPMLGLPTQFGYSNIFWPEEVFDMFIDKAALSANPKSSHDCGTSVMVIYGEYRELAVSKLGDKVWTRVRIPRRRGVSNRCPMSFNDVVFYRGQYYVVDRTGVVYVCDLDGDKGPSATAIAPAPSGTKGWIQKYLVEFSGDLLLVQRVRGSHSPEQPLPDHVVFDSDEEEEEEETEERYHDIRNEYTVKFKVVKLEESSGRKKYPYGWVKVSSLGTKSLFIGKNQSVSISDLKGGIKPNCIYFTDDNSDDFVCPERNGLRRGGGRDMGIFHIDSGITEPLLQPTSLHRYSPPIWYF